MPMMNIQPIPPSGLMSQLAQSQHPLVNTAPNYGFPITSGLMGSLNPGSTDWSQVALQMAGNPKAGPLAPVPIPSGPGIPGPGTGSGGSSLGSKIGGLLSTMATNPGLVKNAGNAVSSIAKLFGGSPTSSGIGTAADGSAITGNSIAGPAAAAAPSLSSAVTASGLVLPTDAAAMPLSSAAIDASIQAGAGMPAADAAFGGAADAAPAADAAATGSAGAGGLSTLGALGVGAAALAPFVIAGGSGSHWSDNGLLAALQAGPNGNPEYSSEVLQALSEAGNWGGGRGGYGGVRGPSSGLMQWLAQNGYGNTSLAPVSPSTPFSVNPYSSRMRQN